MIAAAAQMIKPTVPYSSRVQQTLTSKTRFGQKVRCPRAQGAFQPGADGHVETLLGSIDKVARYVAVEDLPQDPLALAVTNLRNIWQLPGEFHDTMIENRTTCFQTCRHAGTIKLHQNVARKIADHVSNNEVGQKIVQQGHLA